MPSPVPASASLFDPLVKGRYAEDPRKRKRRMKFVAAFMLAVLLLAIEVASLAVLYANQLFKQRPRDYFVEQFFLTRVFIKPFLKEESTLVPPPLRFIGDLTPSQGNWRDFLPTDPLLGYRLGVKRVATYMGKEKYVTNEQGFASIGPDKFYYFKQKPAGVYRVIVVGGSTVMGAGSPTPDQNLPAQIKNELVERLGSRPVEVINAGVLGYTSSQELLYIMSELAYFNPDLIIVYDGWNDASYTNKLLNRFGDDFIPLRTRTHYSLGDRTHQGFFLKGSIFQVLYAVYNKVQMTLRQSGAVALFFKSVDFLLDKMRAQNPPPETKTYDPRSVAIYKENLEKMILLAQYHGFKIALFLQPTAGIDGKGLNPDEDFLLSEIKLREAFYADAHPMFDALRQKYGVLPGVAVADLSMVFSDLKDTVYVDTGHLNLLGNRLIAKRIVEEVAAEDFLPPAHP